MLTVKKFASFEELKSHQNEPENDEVALKRHQEYKKFFEYLRSLVVQQEENKKLECE